MINHLADAFITFISSNSTAKSSVCAFVCVCVHVFFSRFLVKPFHISSCLAETVIMSSASLLTSIQGNKSLLIPACKKISADLKHDMEVGGEQF